MMGKTAKRRVRNSKGGVDRGEEIHEVDGVGKVKYARRKRELLVAKDAAQDTTIGGLLGRQSVVRTD